MQLQKLDEVTSICSWSALWTDATKRKVDRCLQRLQTAGIKTGAKVSDVTLVDLSQKILSEREVIQRRWDLVQKFKRAPEELLTTVDELSLRIWASADAETSVAMVVFACVSLINDLECEKLDVILMLLSILSPSNMLSLRQLFQRRTPDILAAIVAAQKNTISALVDKLFAKMTTEDCTAMSLHMDKVLPAQILTSFQSVDPTNDLASGFVQGFCEGAWMDLSFLHVIGKALQSDGANETLPKVVSLTMADIYLNQDKLGQRLRAHLRSRRAQDNRKTAVRVWAIFRQHFESCKRTIAVKDDLEKLRGAALTLSEKLRASDAEVYNAVVDIFLEEGSENPGAFRRARVRPRGRREQRRSREAGQRVPEVLACSSASRRGRHRSWQSLGRVRGRRRRLEQTHILGRNERRRAGRQQRRSGARAG